MKVLIVLVFCWLIIGCGNGNSVKVYAIPLVDTLIRNDSIQPPKVLRIYNFIVKKYNDNESMLRQLDEMVQHRVNSFLVQEGTVYKIQLYRESDSTNEKNVSKDRGVIGRYSYANDLVLVYTWRNINGLDRSIKAERVRIKRAVENLP